RLGREKEVQRGAWRLLGMLPLPWREEPVLSLRGQEGPLSLLRLLGVGRSFQIPDRTRRHEFSRSGREDRRDGWRADARARRTGGTAREGTRQPDRRHGDGDHLLPGAAAGA